MTLNDAEVIERSMEEPDAFGAIFDRHFGAIFRFCARRMGVDHGEDLAGDVFRWAFENRQGFDVTRVDARPWLFGIANNVVQHALRSSRRQHLAYGRWAIREARDTDGFAAEIAGAVDAERDLCVVAAALELQAADEVEALLLFAWEGLSYAEVAEALTIPVGTVRSRISRARQHLHDVLDTSLGTHGCPRKTPGGSL